jgi:aryl-alcohol dehydrogenase-like predicted oxidoreductase
MADMRFRPLGRSGLMVSVVGIGCNNFGRKVDEAGTAAVVDAALDAGINLFDTADIYSGGEAETYLGRILAGRREDVLISTKAGIPAGPGPNRVGSTRLHLTRQLDGSLRRLNTDYVDILYLHFQDDYTALEDLMRTLADFVSAGKVRYIGVANHAAWRVALALGVSERYGYPSFVAYQGLWNLLARDAEDEILPLCRDRSIGFLAWGPLAGGLLSGKYRRGRERPAGSRLGEAGSSYFRIDEEHAHDVVEGIDAIAERHGATVGQVALAWLLAQPGLVSVVVGARDPDQLAESAGAVEIGLTSDELEVLEALSPRHPHWPQWHLEWRAPWRTGE